MVRKEPFKVQSFRQTRLRCLQTLLFSVRFHPNRKDPDAQNRLGYSIYRFFMQYTITVTLLICFAAAAGCVNDENPVSSGPNDSGIGLLSACSVGQTLGTGRKCDISPITHRGLGSGYLEVLSNDVTDITGTVIKAGSLCYTKGGISFCAETRFSYPGIEAYKTQSGWKITELGF